MQGFRFSRLFVLAAAHLIAPVPARPLPIPPDGLTRLSGHDIASTGLVDARYTSVFPTEPIRSGGLR
jgi:hypothetical protein